MHHQWVGVAPLLVVAAAAGLALAQTVSKPQSKFCQCHRPEVVLIMCCVWRYPADGKHQPIWNDTWMDILRRDLFTTYDRYSRPTLNMTTVKIGMSTHSFELNEAKSTFSANVWVTMVCAEM